jgi:hypothetical protein
MDDEREEKVVPVYLNLHLNPLKTRYILPASSVRGGQVPDGEAGEFSVTAGQRQRWAHLFAPLTVSVKVEWILPAGTSEENESRQANEARACTYLVQVTFNARAFFSRRTAVRSRAGD